MTRTIQKISKQKMYTIASIAFLVAAVVTISFFLMNNGSATQEVSNKNIELYEKAARTGDITICDQIRGGINATDNNNPDKNSEFKFEVALSREYKKMNEEQAKESCQTNVQQVNGRKKSRN